MAADELYREELIVACSPHLLAAGIEHFKAGKGPVFETRALAIQAAVARMGFVVIDPRFIEAELTAGQLVVSHPLRVQLDDAYWLVWRRGRESTRPVAAFRRWLAAELGDKQPVPHPSSLS